MKHLVQIVIVLVSVSLCASAQNRANVPWWNSPVVNDLGLSADQTQQIRKIVRTHRTKLLDARNVLTKAEADLEDLLNDNDQNRKQAEEVIVRIAAARAESSRVFLQMSVELRSVLTLDQWRLLVRRWDEVKKRRNNNTDVQTPP